MKAGGQEDKPIHIYILQPTVYSMSANISWVKASPKVKLNISGAGKYALPVVYTMNIC